MTVKTFQECLSDDLDDVFINPKEFAIAFTYDSPKNSIVAKAVDGIFTDAFEVDAADTEMQVQSIAPVMRIKTADIPGGKVRPGDFVTIKSIVYIIKDDQSDGTGVTDLILKVK